MVEENTLWKRPSQEDGGGRWQVYPYRKWTVIRLQYRWRNNILPTYSFALLVCMSLTPPEAFVCRPSSGEMCCSVCIWRGGGISNHEDWWEDRVHQSRAGAWVLSPRNHPILHQKENPANISCLAEVSGTWNNSITWVIIKLLSGNLPMRDGHKVVASSRLWLPERTRS